jgi:hypothetical protein
MATAQQVPDLDPAFKPLHEAGQPESSQPVQLQQRACVAINQAPTNTHLTALLLLLVVWLSGHARRIAWPPVKNLAAFFSALDDMLLGMGPSTCARAAQHKTAHSTGNFSFSKPHNTKIPGVAHSTGATHNQLVSTHTAAL